MSFQTCQLFIGVTVALSLITGCVDDDPIDAPNERPAYTVATLPDDAIKDVPAILAIAKQEPTFGGMYFDEQGDLVVAMTDVSHSERAQELVWPRLGNHHTKGGAKNGTNVRFKIKHVEYSFLELARYKTLLRDRIFDIDGVATLDANEVKNRVDIGLADMSVQSDVRKVAQDLGIPQNALVFSFAAYPRVAVTNNQSTSSAYGQEVVEGGWLITAPYAGGKSCTLGFTAIRPSSSDSVFVTASHCSAGKWHYEGSIIQQPLQNGDTIGTEIVDPEANTCGTWPYLVDCRGSDAALFRARKPIRFGKLVRLADSVTSGHSSLVVDSSLTITSTLNYVVVNEVLHKIGATSGWTYGLVEQTCVDGDVPAYPDDRTLCSDEVDFHMEAGDSGSPVFSVVSGTNVQLRGIAWGNNPLNDAGYMSNLGQIFSELGLLVIYDPGPPNVDLTGPDVVPPGVLCTWTASVSNGVPPISYSWTGLFTGSYNSIAGIAQTSGWLTVTATDWKGRQDNYMHYLTVNSNAPMPPGCTE